eukprot:CAMPEP_0173418878 /NCGR_PEP_ID=MMETSP1357-20121228/902_1 /TAXON_ID=77926 /ORGANISM="Hemiselmis rufescens, Strain PCC563" /LENGTH=157 /DNA_ID=CAMNT_0014381427 /DNA_START=507 /DNA_END=976 /DNA_ORIENTATION=+
MTSFCASWRFTKSSFWTPSSSLSSWYWLLRREKALMSFCSPPSRTSPTDHAQHTHTHASQAPVAQRTQNPPSPPPPSLFPSRGPARAHRDHGGGSQPGIQHHRAVAGLPPVERSVLHSCKSPSRPHQLPRRITSGSKACPAHPEGWPTWSEAETSGV